jgi:transcription-repair coupling factor (superfamily II helicase)
LPLTALLPEDYVADTELRLNLYRQVAAVETDAEADDLADELRDRFGDFPEEVDHLFALIRLRIRSQKMGIDSLVERDREIVIRPVDTADMDKRRLTNRLGGAIRFTQNSVRLRLLELSLPWEEALDLALSEVERVTRVEEPVFA